METLEEVAAWQKKVQEIVMENSEHHIPAIFHMEGLCGAHSFRIPPASRPVSDRGAGFDPEVEEQDRGDCEPAGSCLRDYPCSSAGSGYLQGFPCGAAGRKPVGKTPALASALGAPGLYQRNSERVRPQDAGRRAWPKHFLAFHNSDGGIHGAVSDTPPRLLEEIYGKPFQAAIQESDLLGIMPCYCTVNGEPVSASYGLLTKLAQEEMGFQGLCISDYGAVGNTHGSQHVGETLEDAGMLCLKAGMDMELPNPSGFGEKFLEKFRTGKAGYQCT
ncbi:MAG: glycoside hydrolase family 3 N-terminal domain-containing protein [Blautia faecis]